MLDLPHGVVNGVLLPHVIRFNGVTVPERFVPIAQAMGLADLAGAPAEESVERVAEEVRRLGDEVGVPKGLGDLGVTEADIPRLAQLTPGRRLPDHEPAPGVGDRRGGAVPGSSVVTTPSPAPPSRSAPWPPRRVRSRTQPDLDALTGLRSGKPHYFPEHRTYAERLRRVILALERISAALMHTTEGSDALVRAVVEAAAEHLCADWVLFALVDGELTESRPRHLVRGPDGAEWPDVGAMPAMVREHLLAVLHCAADDDHDREAHSRHLHVPVRLDGRVVGGFVAWTPPNREVDETDRSVLGILAGQTAAALQNCALLDHSARLLARTTRQADDLAKRHAELQATQAELGAARQREVLDSERHRIARELHDSVTQYALSAGMHIELARDGCRGSPAAHPPRHRQGPHAPRRRAAAVGDLRAAPRRGRGGRGPAVDAPPALGCPHAGRAAGRGADRRQAGAAAPGLRAVALPDRG